jgi:hypothetical protein
MNTKQWASQSWGQPKSRLLFIFAWLNIVMLFMSCPIFYIIEYILNHLCFAQTAPPHAEDSFFYRVSKEKRSPQSL